MCDHLVNSSARLSGSMYRNSVNISVSIYVVERQQNYYGTKNLPYWSGIGGGKRAANILGVWYMEKGV